MKRRVWLFVESIEPKRWGIRYGNQWMLVDDVGILIPMVTRTQKHAPRMYLFGYGVVEKSLDGKSVIIREHSKETQ